MSEIQLICSDCGAVPDEGERPPSTHCRFCGTKLVTRDELPRDIWKDPAVKEALKSGRPANDIAVVRCPECDQYGYYNEGSTFSCRFCDKTFSMMSEEAGDYVVRLDDTLTETTDGYDNRTL